MLLFSKAEVWVLAERVEAAVHQSNRGERRALVNSPFVAFTLIERRVVEASDGGPGKRVFAASSQRILAAALERWRSFLRLFVCRITRLLIYPSLYFLMS